jgi:hypothetical protein
MKTTKKIEPKIKMAKKNEPKKIGYTGGYGLYSGGHGQEAVLSCMR